jgi:hypothetical protein
MNSSLIEAVMTTQEMLNPQDHSQLRLRPGEREPHFVQIVASEFAAAALCCPIVFTKEATTGAFYAGALLGLKPEEGALRGVEERGGFNPLSLQRDGFYIAGTGIAIDRASPRFSETEGEPLFDSTGQPAVALRNIQRVLGQLQAGIAATDEFLRALTQLRLIEPIDVALTFQGGEQITLRGLYTVSLDALRGLDDAAALRLFRNGYLQLAYLAAASVQQIAVLAGIRNRHIVA